MKLRTMNIIIIVASVVLCSAVIASMLLISHRKVLIDGYATNISALEAKPGLDKVGTVTSVAGANGIKVTGTATTTPVVEIDTAAVFILDCGTATTNID